MPVEVNQNSINSQQIEVDVNGPDDVNKMFMISGQANISLSASTSPTNQNVSRDETFKIKLDPHIKNTEFRRSIGNANFSGISLFDAEDSPANTFETLNFRITDVDADYDDESEQVELRVSVHLEARGERNSVTTQNIGFNVTTLAAMSDTTH